MTMSAVRKPLHLVCLCQVEVPVSWYIDTSTYLRGGRGEGVAPRALISRQTSRRVFLYFELFLVPARGSAGVILYLYPSICLLTPSPLVPLGTQGLVHTAPPTSHPLPPYRKTAIGPLEVGGS